MIKNIINILAISTVAFTFNACGLKNFFIDKEDELTEANKCQVLKRTEKDACYNKILETNSYAMIRVAVNEGQKRNPEKALEYFAKAKELGNHHANLGEAYIYFKGMGVKKNSAKAATILEEVAEKSPNAAFQLARFYLTGDGVKKDVDRGIELLEFSAEEGLYNSQKKLYEIYTNGDFGLNKNSDKANKWKKIFTNNKRNDFLEAYKY